LTTSAYGEATPARAILLSIYLAIGLVSATEVPDSACLKANAICSSEKCFFPNRKTHPFW